ncbi:hypothetical protein BGZ63DRAFT_366565, partial [Mariannaea sp. PMI_226]
RQLLPGLTNCIDEDLPSSSVAKRRWLKTNDSNNKYLFGSRGHIAHQSMKRVELFPALWSIYRSRLGVPGEAFWLSSARAKS